MDINRSKGISFRLWYTAGMDNICIYLHIPFCTHRCAYCDFNTYAGIEGAIPAYVEALCREIEYLKSYESGLKVHTVYFGGGTPSLLPTKALDRLLTTLRTEFVVADNVEVTIEANPGTLSLDYLRQLRELGFNRLSLGMQSANPFELYLLERKHNYFDVINAVLWGRIAGFNNLNLDLIYGLPNQSERMWQASLQSAIELKPEHFSIYALDLGTGTPMHRWVNRGLLNAPDADQSAAMYEWGCKELEAAGYYLYELSGWAKVSDGDDNYECRHNLQYWRNHSYLGIGAGAHGFAGGFRVANVLHPSEYINRMSESRSSSADIDDLPFPRTPATAEMEEIAKYVEMQETMMLGLRLLREGVSTTNFESRFHRSMQEVFGGIIKRLLEDGLVEWVELDGKILRLSQRGRLLGNHVFMEFV